MLNLYRDKTYPVRCPFCRGEIPRPAELEGGWWYEFAGGECGCGAFFAHDPTARNGGAVLLQALVQSCHGDWDEALSLAPGVDYDEGFVEHYNSRTHRIEGQAFGTLYFIKRRQ